jgi:hypothetical protein
MSPQRPTGRGSAKRPGFRRRAVETSPIEAPERRTISDSPSDLSAIVNILERAMHGGSQTAEPSEPAGRHQPASAPSAIENLRTDSDARIVMPAAALPESATITPAEGVAFDEVARSLAAAEACVPLLAQSTGLMRLAALDVVKAETSRAGGLLQLLRFLRGDIVPARTAVSTSGVIQRVVQAADPERRLRGIALTTRSSVADVTFAGDETLLANTILALLLTTFALLEGMQNGRVTLAVTVNDEGEIGIAVSQDQVPPPPGWASRAVTELTGDAATIVHGIATSAAQRLARESAGRFAAASGERSSILTIWLPAVQASAGNPPAH